MMFTSCNATKDKTRIIGFSLLSKCGVAWWLGAAILIYSADIVVRAGRQYIHRRFGVSDPKCQMPNAKCHIDLALLLRPYLAILLRPYY